MFFSFIIMVRNLAVGQFYMPAQGNHIRLLLLHVVQWINKVHDGPNRFLAAEVM